MRQFLLTNLERQDASSPWKFRLPLDYLLPAIDEIGKFPYQPGERVYERPTLFLKGALPAPSSMPSPVRPAPTALAH